MSGPKIAILIYSMYGHVGKMAESAKKGIESAGGHATILQVPETLPQEVLTKMYAPPKPDYPVAKPTDLLEYDAILIGISTRYGGWPAQFKTFWDATGQLWAQGALTGKFAAAFVSTAGPGGGQESTYFSILSTLVHHGLIFVPLGYKHTNALWKENFEVVHGGSPFGAGTYSNSDGSRQPTEMELEVASIQAREFYNVVKRYVEQSKSTAVTSLPEGKKETSVAGTSAAAKTPVVADTAHKAELSTATTNTSTDGSTSKPKKRRSVLGKIIQQFKG